MKKKNINKSWAIGIIVLVLGLNIIPITTSNSEIQKSTLPTLEGNTLYVGGNGPNNYTKIQDAIDNASEGDTVFVFDDSSPYKEHIIINKSISVIGEKKESTIIDGNNDGNVVNVTDEYINIQGFTIKNGSTSNGIGSGIFVSSNFTFIDENIFLGNDFAIRISNSNINIISNNNIENNERIGIWLHNSSGNLLMNNTIVQCGTGISTIYKSVDNNITKNIIMLNKNDGISIGVWCHNTFISDNIIESNECNGIEISGGLNMLITGNDIIKNKHSGITIWSTKKTTILLNNIKQNKIGLNLLDADEPLIKNNNFGENILHATFLINYNNRNQWESNYWGRHRILPKIIFGREVIKQGSVHPPSPPVIAPRIRFDFSPATEPYEIP